MSDTIWLTPAERRWISSGESLVERRGDSGRNQQDPCNDRPGCPGHIMVKLSRLESDSPMCALSFQAPWGACK